MRFIVDVPDHLGVTEDHIWQAVADLGLMRTDEDAEQVDVQQVPDEGRAAA